jgi:hypothetical protein
MNRAIPVWHLAQCNIARANGPTDAPVMAEFMAALDEINALADRAPGFVWRLQDDNGNLTDLRIFDDADMLVNLSVWESVDTLRDYTYRSAHAPYVKRRREWFTKPEGLPVLAMWWIPAGERPTAMEGKRRLEHLAANGPTPIAFTFARRFEPPA